VASAPITVTVNVSGPVIWFVDDSAAGGGNGTLGSPFDALADADAVDAASHRIFVYSGTYSTGLTLNSSEWLVGQGAVGASFDAFMGISPPAGTTARPSINGTAPTLQSTVTAATSSVISGLAISTAANGFVASGATGFTVSSVTVASSGGTAVSVSGGANPSSATFTSVSSSGTAAGISMSAAAGTWNFGTGSLAGSGTGFSVSGGNATVTYGGTIATTAAVRPVNIASATGGTVTLAGGITASGSALGISLSSNTGATITFRGGLSLSTGGNAAFSATGGGTVNVCATADCASGSAVTNTLTTTTGTPLTVTSTTIGSSNMTFRSITASGAANGILLSSTGSSGGLVVTGDGASSTSNSTRGRTTAGASGTLTLASGGTLTNTTGDAISLSSTSNVVLRNMTITGGSNDGIDATSVTTLTIDNTRVTGKAAGYGLQGTTVSGLSIIHSEFESNATTAGVETTDIWNVKLTNPTGSGLLQHSLFRDTRETVFGTINNAANTISMTVTNCRFADASTSGVGANGFLASASSTATVSVAVTGSEFSNIDATGFQYSGTGSSGGGTVSVATSTFSQNSVDIDIAHEGLSRTVTYDISNNTLRQTAKSGGTAAATSIELALGTSATTASTLLSGTIANNVIGATGVANSGGTRGIRLEGDQAGSIRASITGNTIRETSLEGIWLRGLTTQTGRIDVTLSGNDIVADLTAVESIGLLIDSGSLQGTQGIICTAFGANTAFRGSASGYGIGAVASLGIVELQGYGGANNDSSAIMSFLDGRATTVDPASATLIDSPGLIRAGTCITP
jgi:hypothetical protein